MMAELVTNRITATALWIPEAWGKYGFTQKAIEEAVVHAIHEEKDEIILLDTEKVPHWFGVNAVPLEFQSKPPQGVLEINEFTLMTMTRHYVSLTPEAQ